MPAKNVFVDPKQLDKGMLAELQDSGWRLRCGPMANAGYMIKIRPTRD